MNFALILLGLILGGLLTIVFLVLAVIAMANSRTNKALGWGAGFVAALAIVVISVFQLVHKVSDKVKEGLEWTEAQQSGHNNNMNNNDEAHKAERQEWLDSLQLHNIAKYESTIPADFYTNRPAVKDSKGLIRIPFLYPFEFRYNSVSYTGDIVMEGEDSVFVENVSQIAFDENFAIIKADNSQSPDLLKAGHPEMEYMLFDLRTRNFENASTMEGLLDLGRRIGYTGPQQLQYLSDACRGWIEYPSND
ncbi:MAG: hypothetical protein JWO09_2733 [Bacteroidetes bacterium]|nr:hypothetical protein [Bacteroidota bacterium]